MIREIVQIVIKFHLLGIEYPKIKDTFKQIFSSQTAYQITSLLEGVVKRGTAKKLKDLKFKYCW